MRVGSGSRVMVARRQAVQARVGRHEDEVMRDHEPEVPYEQLFHVAAAEDLVERERDDGKAAKVSQEMQRACPVAAPEAEM